MTEEEAIEIEKIGTTPGEIPINSEEYHRVKNETYQKYAKSYSGNGKHKKNTKGAFGKCKNRCRVKD